MDKQHNQGLEGEVDSAFAYLRRLIQVSTTVQVSFKYLVITKNILVDLTEKAFVCLDLGMDMKQNNGSLQEKDIIELEQIIDQLRNFLISTIELNLNPLKTRSTVVEVINTLYESCHELHLALDPDDQLAIQLPRLNLIRIINQNEQNMVGHYLPQFGITPETLKHTGQAKIFCLNQIRKNKQDNLIKRGHNYISQKNFKDALQTFVEANEVLKTAQSLTLIGWAHSLQGNFSKAKQFCFEAIKHDPDYGNPYNDIGSYLLSEGKIKESFSWFSLAKKAKFYLNREFPYINSAKAHLMMKNYKKALNEFSGALELAPYHKELQKTVNKLKNFVHKKDFEQEIM